MTNPASYPWKYLNPRITFDYFWTLPITVSCVQLKNLPTLFQTLRPTSQSPVSAHLSHTHKCIFSPTLIFNCPVWKEALWSGVGFRSRTDITFSTTHKVAATEMSPSHAALSICSYRSGFFLHISIFSLCHKHSSKVPVSPF